MKRHPTTSSQWFAEQAEALASSGIVDLIRRRSQQLLFASAMHGELERFGARPRGEDLALRAAESARGQLLRAWAIAESSRRRESSGAGLQR